MSNEWIGIVNTTAPKYLKGASDLTIRKRLLLAMLERRGKIMTDVEGSTDLWWDVQFAEAPVEAYGDGGLINYSRRDLYRQARLDWRGYLTTDQMGKKESLMNKGTVAIVDRYKRILPTLMSSMRNKFSTELYIDGYASGNENRVLGFESFLNYTESPSSNYKMVQPNDTYGGLSTALHQSGTWTAAITEDIPSGLKRPTQGGFDWPLGSGDPDFDFWSPKLYNWSASSWATGITGGAVDWKSNCEHVLRQAVQDLSLTTGAEGPPNVGMLSGDLFYGFKNSLAADRRIIAPAKEAEDLGFPMTINDEGLSVHTEFGVPGGTGYILNVDEMELDSLAEDLFGSDGPTWDPKTYSYLFSVAFFGNMKYRSPKYFAKIFNYA